MKLSFTFFMVSIAFLLIVGCSQGTTDLESVEGIEFKMMEIGGLLDNRPKKLHLVFLYEKDDTGTVDAG